MPRRDTVTHNSRKPCGYFDKNSLESAGVLIDPQVTRRDGKSRFTGTPTSADLLGQATCCGVFSCRSGHMMGSRSLIGASDRHGGPSASWPLFAFNCAAIWNHSHATEARLTRPRKSQVTTGSATASTSDDAFGKRNRITRAGEHWT